MIAAIRFGDEGRKGVAWCSPMGEVPENRDACTVRHEFLKDLACNMPPFGIRDKLACTEPQDCQFL